MEPAKSKALWSVTSKSIGVGLPIYLRTYIVLLCVPGASHGTTGLNVCAARFWSCFCSILFILLFLPFGVGMFTLYNYILGLFNLLLSFVGIHS